MGGSSSKEAPPPPATAVKKEDAATTPPKMPIEDYTAPLPYHELPKDLQKIVDRDDSIWEQIYDGSASESTNSNIRYAAYASRFRTILLSAHRYVAYTSDIGESFRPIAHPGLIRTAYGISWAYLIGDVSYEGYKAYLRQQHIMHPGVPGVVAHEATDAVHEKKADSIAPPQGHMVAPIDDYRAVMVQRAVFQSIASMGLPAFTIHSIVKYAGRALKNAKNPTIKTWGPIGLGLAAVPALPILFDKPVEEAVEWTFHKAFLTIGGPNAVGNSPRTGRESDLQADQVARTAAEKKDL